MSKPPPSTIESWQIVLLVVLLLCSMFFSAAETAFLSLNKLRIRYLDMHKNKKAQHVTEILKNKQRFLTTGLIANSIVNNLITVIITMIAVAMFQGGNAVSIAVVFATVLILIFGEIVPKNVALVYAEPIALNASRIMRGLMVIFIPVVNMFEILSRPFLFLFGIRKNDKSMDVTEDDLKTFFEEREKNGQLSQYERTMMEKILGYADIQAKNIMTPRPEIKAVHIDTSIDEVLQLSKQSRFSRFPVYDEDIDDIKGIFYLKDFLLSPEFAEKGNTDDAASVRYAGTVRDFLREPVFIFEGADSAKIHEVFHSEAQNMLIVVDEYGGTAGILTTEDLTEEVFGDIEDEYDLQTPDTMPIKTPDGFIIAGSMQISEFNEQFGTKFSDTQHETIAGVLLERFGELPGEKAKIQIDGYTFEILETSAKKIKRIKVIRS